MTIGVIEWNGKGLRGAATSVTVLIGLYGMPAEVLQDQFLVIAEVIDDLPSLTAVSDLVTD